MKILGKTEDRVIDNLLRAQSKRPGGPPSICSEFDPDLANAYVEHSLTSGERSRYERHLSDCNACRKSVVALARMAASDTISAPGSFVTRIAPVPRTSPLAAFKGLFATPAWMRAGVAAAAAVALAVTIPILLSRKDAPAGSAEPAAQLAQSQATDQEQEGSLGKAKPQPAQVLDSYAAASHAASPAAPKSKAAPEEATENQQREDRVAERKQDVAVSASASGAVARAEPPQTQPVEAKNQPAASDEASHGAETGAQMGAQPLPAAPQPAEELARIDSRESLRLPSRDKESAQVNTLKPGAVGSDAANIEREKTATITPKDTLAPRPESSTDDLRGRRSITQGPQGHALRERSSSESARARSSAERKIVNKKFRLLDGVWTDKSYNPGKEMPLVTIIRDTDVYKELLNKRSGLKAYFLSFTEGDTVIVVHKGTVYKLIPQEASK